MATRQSSFRAKRTAKAGVVALATTLVTLLFGLQPAGALPPWGNPFRVEGAQASQVLSVSCPVAGNCTAGGEVSVPGGTRAFAINEKAGVWGTPTVLAVPLDVKKGGQIDAISCWRAGYCGAAGIYKTAAGTEAFADIEKIGVWGPAVPIALVLNPGDSATIGGIACPDGKFCSLVGDGTALSGNLQGFAATWLETWHAAQPISAPGSQPAWFDAISCNVQGRCSAGGDYPVPGSGGMADDAFIVDQVNDVWQSAAEIAGNINVGRAYVSSISCVRNTEYCAAVGEYSGANGAGAQGFTDVKASTTWSPAHEVPGSPADTHVDGAGAFAVACTSPGQCSAGGTFGPSSGNEAYVVNESGGTWGNARVVAQNLNLGHNAATQTVSCDEPGDCIATGYYTHHLNGSTTAAFVVHEVGGVWGTATAPPGLPSTAPSQVNSSSCAPAYCAFGGQYTFATHHVAFVTVA